MAPPSPRGQSPQDAPPRPDLVFLRHRSARPALPEPAQAPERSAAPASAVADFVASRGPHPHAGQPAAAPPAAAARPSASLDLASLDLSPPAATPRPPASLDLGSPAAARPPASLDLSTPNVAAPSAPAQSSPKQSGPQQSSPQQSGPQQSSPQQSSAGRHPLPRARSDSHVILTPKAPVLALSRVQSGVGMLSVQAACSELVGDLRLGCAYQLRDGRSSTVQHAGGNAQAPKDSRNPIIAGRHEQYERILIDLRHSRQLERFAVYAFSESGQQLRWGGTLVVSSFGGARIELPLDRPPSTGVAMLLSVHNVRGEFVLRAEMEIIAGSIRDACKAYGYDRITWLDDKTPVG